jgi:hypothetical protein
MTLNKILYLGKVCHNLPVSMFHEEDNKISTIMSAAKKKKNMK